MRTHRFHLTLFLAVCWCFASWFYATNQCALGLLPDAADTASAVETCGDQCGAECGGESEQPAPEGGRSPECLANCLGLRLALPPTDPRLTGLDRTYFTTLVFAIVAMLPPEAARLTEPVAALDTGPPFAFSFAEVVLQESLFSHAPPRLA